MGLVSLEHGKVAYWADFAVHGAAVGGLALALVLDKESYSAASALSLAATGWALWTLVEYAGHRFLLHDVAPFKHWHAEHHARPMALIAAPTLLSASLLCALVFLPAWWLMPLWAAQALSLGVVSGYLAYGLAHHAAHHWRSPSAWMQRRKRWHALHHHRQGGHCYGVSTGFWDRRFRSGPAG